MVTICCTRRASRPDEATVKSNSDSTSRNARGEQSLHAAMADLAAGRMILVVDDAEQPRQGEVCVAAQLTTPEHIGFMAVHARGLVCLAVLPPTLLRLAPKIRAGRPYFYQTRQNEPG